MVKHPAGKTASRHRRAAMIFLFLLRSPQSTGGASYLTHAGTGIRVDRHGAATVQRGVHELARGLRGGWRPLANVGVALVKARDFLRGARSAQVQLKFQQV